MLCNKTSHCNEQLMSAMKSSLCAATKDPAMKTQCNNNKTNKVGKSPTHQ